MEEKALMEIKTDLAIVKHFMKPKEYKKFLTACSFKLPGTALHKISRVKGGKPSPADFLKSMNNLALFIQGTKEDMVSADEEASTEETLRRNTYGYHSETVIECMNIAFVNGEYKSIEKMAELIDPQDQNETESVLQLYHNIMDTRNNLTTQNVQ